MDNSGRRVQYLITLSASLATFTMGITSSWASVVIPKFANETSIHMDKYNIAWMVSCTPLGFVTGSLIAGLILDRIGRRATLLVSSMPYNLGMVFLLTAVHPSMLYLTTISWYIGVGILSTVMPLYFSEISDKEIRGTLSLLTRTVFNFGNVVIMCVGPYLTYNLLNRLIMLLPAAYFIICFWIPESPYQYLKDGNVENARKVLEKLRGKSDKIHHELEKMKNHVASEMQQSTSILELIRGRQYRKALVISAGLKLTSIMTGGVSISQYLGLIMEESAIVIDKRHTQLIFGLTRFVVSVMPSVLVDRVGRKPLLVYSYIGSGISLAIVGIYFFCHEVLLIDIKTLSPYGFITLTGIISSTAISILGYNSLASLIPGEIFPLNVKATALPCVGIFSGGVGFVSSKSYQALKDCIGLCGVFWVFAFVSFVGATFSKLCVIETKGKSLEEIQRQLQGAMYTEEGFIKLNDVGNGGLSAKTDGTEVEELNKKENS